MVSMSYKRTVGAVVMSAFFAGCGPDTSGGEVDASPANDAVAVDAPVDAIPIDAPPPPDVEVVITADNAYSFGYGDVAGITHFTQGTRAQTAGQIFNCPLGEGPEAYTVPSAMAPDAAYLYIVTWDDLSVTQGVLGQFKRGGDPVYTGTATWDVCATGIDLSASTVGPTQAEINAQITICNAGSGAAGTTSEGWVNLAGAVTAGARRHARRRRSQRSGRRRRLPAHLRRRQRRHRRCGALDVVPARRRRQPVPLDGQQHLPRLSDLPPGGRRHPHRLIPPRVRVVPPSPGRGRGLDGGRRG